MLKIRRPLGRLIFNMGIAIPGKTVFLIETAPSAPNKQNTVYSEQRGNEMVVNGSLTGLMVMSEEHSRADYKPIDRLKEYRTPDSKVHGANTGPTWVLSSPGGHHVGPINHAIRGSTLRCLVILILLFA